MSYPFDTVSAGIVAAINGRKDGTLTSTQAAELLEPLLETIAPSQLSQLNSVIQVLGRAKGLFFTNGVPANTLGAIGSSAIDLENHMFYGPKTSLGWPAGIQFVGDTGAPGESYADIARNLGNVFGVPVDEDSTDAEVLIAVAQAAANLVTPGFNSILVELHGAIPNNPAIDNAAAINAAETAAALVGATVEFRAGATYYFKSQIGGNRNGLTWVGKNTSLVYNGASTTIDLVKFGNDSTEKTGMLVQGISVQSLTTMTAGAAVRTPLVCRSRFEFINIQGQDYRETNGNKLYNGIYADRVDNVHFSGTDIVAQNNGFMLRGTTGVGPKADCWVDFRKICYCTVGFLMGGAFGGAYIGVNDYIVNGTDVLANQSLQAEQNRELFINGGIFDGATNASSASIVLDDPGALLVQINGSWIASGLGHGVWIKQSTGKIILSSPRIWNFAKDGIRNDVGSSAVISISDAQIHDNGAWGVNPTVSGHHTTVADSRLFSNVSGNINTTYAPASRAMTNYADITNLTSKYVLSDQLFVDALYGSYLSGGNPYLSYDSNDYSVYDRSVNRYAIFVNGGQVFSASTAGVNIGPGNDALLTRGGAGVIDQRNGVNAQSFRLYNTYTDGSNYEYGGFGWYSNTLVISTANAGTGVARNIQIASGASILMRTVGVDRWSVNLSGHFLANADNTYDIGASGANRPRNLYTAGSIWANSGFNLGWEGRSKIQSPSDGVVMLLNNAGSDFGRLQFGGSTSSFPSLKRVAAGLHLRLADDSALGALTVGGFGSDYLNVGNAGDVVLLRSAAGILGMRNGTNAQAVHVFNTFTDGSNFERAVVAWDANVLKIGTQKLGTGVSRAVQFQMGGTNIFQITPSGHLTWNADNTFDIGASGANRPRNGYFGGTIVSAGFQVASSASFYWSSRSVIKSPSDGVITLFNQAETDFSRLQFGGTTSAFPALKRNGTALDVRLADDSAYAGLTAASFFSAGSIRVTNDSGVFSLGTSSDTILARDAANTLALRNGVNAQALRVYNTYTDASNYERGGVFWNSNNFDITIEKLGTGLSRNLRIYNGSGSGELHLGTDGWIQWRIASGHLLANIDNAHDIGASGANRVRSIYAGSNVIAGGIVQTGGTSAFAFGGRSVITSPADGVLAMSNNASTDFGRLIGGPSASASYPAWKRSGASWEARLGDDTGYAVIYGASLGLYAGGASVSFGTAQDLTIIRDAADTLAQRRGTNAQAFRLYNTYTDGSNFERGVVGWNTNNFDVNTAQAGTGTSRNLRLYTTGAGELQLGINSNISWKIGSGGHWLANTDATYNIGAVGASRPNNIYAAGVGVFGSSVTAAGGFQAAASASFYWNGRSIISSPNNGNITLTNVAQTDFGLLILGNATSSFPAWKRSGAGFQARLADDSALTSVEASNLFSTSLFLGSGGVAQWGDTKLYRDAAAILAQRDGTTAQTFRVYNTYTDASNFERASISWGSNVFSIRTGGAGTGTQRAFTVDGSTFTVATGGTDRWTANGSGHLLAASDNTYDIGASGATRPRTIYAGTSIIVPTPAVADSSTKVATTAFVTNLTTTGRNRVFVEDYGAVAGNSSIDNASAINAAETAAAAIGAEVCFKSNASYYFKSVIGGARNGLMWTGLNTSLIYNGASTTLADMVLFGDDTNIYYDMKVEGFIIRSLTNMTAGNAMRTPLICRSTFDVGIQGQDFYQANGNYIYNGIYADRIDNVRYNGLDCIAKNKGFTIRGATSTGPKAGCWMNINKIALCALAIHIGGAFGGIMIGATDLIQNGINMRVDQGLQAEENREIFCNGTIFDVTTNAGEANIVLNDAGNTFIDIRNAWVASSAGHGVWIKQGTGKIMFSAVRIFNNAGDGFRSDVGAGALINIVGGQIHNNGGYGINPTNASGNYIRIGDTISFASNTSGAVNETYLNSAGPATLSQRYFGVANGSGVLTIAHGDSALPNKLLNVTAFYEHATGVSIPLTMNYIDGTNLVFNANASAASKNCRVLVTSQTAAKWS